MCIDISCPHCVIYPHDRISIRHLWLNTGWITELDSNTSECTSFSPSAYVYHSVPRTTFNYISLHHWVWKCRAAARRWQVTMHEKHSCCQGISVLTWHRSYQGLARCCPKVDSGTTKTCSFFSSDFVFHNKFWACQFYKPDFSKNIVFLSACVSLQQLSFFSLHISSITPEDCTQAGVGVIWVLTFTNPSVKECKFHDIPDMFIHKKTIWIIGIL